MDLLRTEGCPEVDPDTAGLFNPARYDCPGSAGIPHAAWRVLRSRPAPWMSHTSDGVRIWSVTTLRDVAAVLRDTRRLSSEYGTILAVRHGDPAGGRTINLTDPPRHRALRIPTSKAMTTQALRAMSGQIEANVREMVAPLLEPGVVDAAEVFLALAMAAMGPIVCIPADMWPMIGRAAMAGVAPEDPVYAAGDAPETLHSAHVELFGFLRSLVAERRRRPGEDLVSLLLTVEVEGKRLTDDEILLNCYSFLMGANTTTPHVATQLIHLMAGRPELFKEISAPHTRTTTVVEEALRWSSPINHLLRRAIEPVDINGVTVPRGELVCAWVASANRDEKVFSDPDSFVTTRRPNPHIAFGAGAHICVGALSARMVLRLALNLVLTRVSALELAGPVRHLRSNFINGITELPVEVRS
jgi:cytochrome P450